MRHRLAAAGAHGGRRHIAGRGVPLGRVFRSRGNLLIETGISALLIGAAIISLSLNHAGSAALLDDVRELMGEKALAPGSSGRVGPAAEGDILPHGVGERVDFLCARARPPVGMHPHPAEVMAETGFHRPPGRLLQRLPARRDRFRDEAGRRGAFVRLEETAA